MSTSGELKNHEFVPPDLSAPNEQTHSRAPVTADGHPLWESIELDVLCSRCAYNLRGLTNPRCPECGLEFNWTDVIDRCRWQNDWLFEHNWSKRPLRSYFATLKLSFRPSRFWKQLSIHEPIRKGPLWFFLLSSCVWYLLILHTLATTCAYAINPIFLSRLPQGVQDYQVSPVLARIRWYFTDLSFESMTHQPGYLVFPAAVVIYLVLVLIFICSLRQTLGKARVRSAQVLRTVAYSLAPASVLSPIMTLLMVLANAATKDALWDHGATEFLLRFLFVFVGVASLPAIYLGTGLRQYLMVPQPRVLALTALITAHMTVLAMLIVVFAKM